LTDVKVQRVWISSYLSVHTIIAAIEPSDSVPELPDIEAYLAALRRDVVRQRLEGIRLRSIFLVRSTDPPLSALHGRTLEEVWRVGKRLVLGFRDGNDTVFAVLHLMISGRLRWSKRGAGLPGKRGLCAFDFENGTLLLTEASKKKRASLYVVGSRAGVEDHNPGGLELLDCSQEDFHRALTAKNHTLKRALTDPRMFSGIGGAYADEIMHAAGLSPIVWTSRLGAPEISRLFDAARELLVHWSRVVNEEAGGSWPTVTAFRDDMAVHGKYGQPCPVCGSPVQRIVYAETETNYCASCQTGGKILADRSLSRLLKSDWPRTLEELEERGRAR
jgi:formamidopyrimidine-DNA glycosylase